MFTQAARRRSTSARAIFSASSGEPAVVSTMRASVILFQPPRFQFSKVMPKTFNQSCSASN
jgi:hypothetical protein